MLESLVAWVLNNYIGEYFQLDTEQLSVAFLQGQVDLTNVPIRPHALRKFDIPIQIKCGLIGKLQLQVPLVSRTQPWVLKIEDFLVVLGPCSAVYDVECVEQYQQQRREKQLDEIEQLHKKQLLAQIGIQIKEDAVQDEQNSWWGASLLSTISNNIQIRLENIHIKYECEEYNFGINVHTLAIETTNSHWRPGFVEPSEGANIFKKFDIVGFSMYWNPKRQSNSQLFGSTMGMSKKMIKNELIKNFAAKNIQTNYILQPLSLDMRIEKNSSRLPLRAIPHIPRFKIDIRSRKIEMEFNKKQIAQMQQFSQNWVLFERARQHRKWRPIASIGDSPKQWWRFAIGRVIEEIRSRYSNFRSVKTLCTRLKLLNAYSRAYRCRLECYLEGKLKLATSNTLTSIVIPKLKLTNATKTDNTTALIKQIEHDENFSYDDLHILREAVFNQFSYQLKCNNEGKNDISTCSKRDDSPFEMISATRNKKADGNDENLLLKNSVENHSNIQEGQGWLNWMTSWLQGENPKENSNETEDLNEAIYLNLRPPKLDKHSLAPELEEIERRMEAELLQVLNESFEDSNILRRDNLLAELVLNFNHAFLRVADENTGKTEENGHTSTMLTFDLDKLCSRVQLSPKEHRIELSLSVKDLSVQQIQLFQSPTANANTCSSNVSDEKSGITSNKNFNDIITQEDEAFNDSAFEIDSLACGFQDRNNALKTRLLLTIGRTYDDDEDPKDKRISRKRRSKKSINEPKRDNCILKLFYKRLAPKLEVYHELNLICAPLSVISDEFAFKKLWDIFDSKNNDEIEGENVLQPETFDNTTINDSNSLEETIAHQMFASLTCPELIIELRSQKAANNCLFSPHFDINTQSASAKKNSMEIAGGGCFGLEFEEMSTEDPATFVRSILQMPYLTFTRREGCQHLAKMDLTFDSFLLEDLFENQPQWPLLRIVENPQPHLGMKNENLSNSCPASLNFLSAMDFDSIVNPSSMNSPSNFSTTRKRYNSNEEYEKIGQNNESQKLDSAHCFSGGGERKNPGKILRRMHTLQFLFIPSEHPDWATRYNKANCKILGHFDDQQTNVELNMNRRTWILLFDFFGLTSPAPEARIESKMMESYLVSCELNATILVLAMNFPQNQSQLGICKIQHPKLEIQLDLGIIDNPHIVSLTAHSLSLTDFTPIYGRFYSEILKIESRLESMDMPSININFMKYRTMDATTFNRAFDVLLAVEIGAPLHYIHTHRHFYALMDFWLQFADLYDKVTLNNIRIVNKQEMSKTTIQQLNSALLKIRCQLNLELQDGVNLYVPQHICSSQSILFSCNQVQANNAFCWASSLTAMLNRQQIIHFEPLHPELNRSQSTASTKLLNDCLLDSMSVHCHNLSVKYGNFICARQKNNSANLMAESSRAFSEYLFQTNPFQIVMESNESAIVLDVYRNLSAAISHNVPALFVLFKLQNVHLKLTTDFYKLLRGCMDHNFGEQIVPQAETFPLELLELPEIISPTGEIGCSEKYSTFSLRVSLKKVLLQLCTPISPIEPNLFEEFAKLHIHAAKLCYDAFADSQSEFDFICESATMEDSRLPESGKNVSESFKKVLKIRSSNFVGITRIESLQTVNTGHSSMATKTSPQNSVDAHKLLFELHIQMRKEECPVFSMIFVRTRIFLLMDWIRQFQTFLLLNSEFRPPSNPAENENFDALLLQSTLSLFEMPKKGVILRTISPSSTRLQQKLSGAAKNTQNTIKETRIVEKDISGKFSMKITLKDCELIALEDPRREDTFALIALTTGVILCDNLKKNELLESQYEIQQFSLHWCSMRRDNAETGLCTQLTNETSATIVISYEHKEKKAVAISDSNNQPLLLNEKQRCLPPQIILTQIGPLIIRGSLKDYFIVKNIYDSAYALWENAQEINFFWANLTEEAIQVETIVENLLFPTEFAVPVKMPQSHLASQQKFVLNADSLCIWILKETVGGVNEKKECVGEGSIAPFLRININEMNLQSTNFTTKIRLLLAMDYYRELVAPLGWEPLLEKWQIANFIAAFTEQGNWSLIIKGTEDCLMELNLTQTFIQEFLDFQAEDIQTIWEIFNAPDNEGLEKLRNKGYSRAIITDSEDHPKTASESDYIPEKFTKNVGDGKLYTNLLAKKIIDPKAQFSNQGISIDLQIDLDAGIGISLIGNDEQNEDTDKNSEQHQEELIYARLSGVRANLQKRKHIYQLGCCINSISMDNQIFGADRFNFFFCDPNALRDEPVSGPLPALNFEMSYSCSEFWDAYESFRLKLCNSCILLDEQLFWRLINFGINVYFHRAQKDSEQKELPEITRNCYFGVFQLELGEISLSVMTIDKNILPSKLRTLKDAYSDKFVLFSFENAAVNLSPFWAHRCYTTLGNLFANVGDFYISELKRQKLNILISMDAFGNPIGFVNELKEGAEGLLFEGDLAGFTFGIGYGAANSISKMASSLAKGVGTLTFDEQHEQLRRKMLRSKPDESNALTHLYGGLKGFGVGVFGALTAIPKNTITATKQDGITGVFRGVTTGAVDTLTKPLQGAFDFIEGTASAIKEVVGAPLVRRAHFPKNRLRLARVCSSLNGLLPPQYSYELAIGQQELLRITGAFTLNDENRLLCIVNFLERLSADRTSRILHRALICLTRCYILREVDEQSTVNYRILYQNLRKVQLANQQQEQHQTSQFKPSTTNKNHHAAGNIGGTSTRMTAVEVFYHQSASDKSKEQMKASTSTSNFYHRLSAKPTQTSSQTPALTLWCADRQTAQQLCKQIMKAKAQFDRRGIGKGMRTDQQQQTTSKKKPHSSSIFTI